MPCRLGGVAVTARRSVAQGSLVQIGNLVLWHLWYEAPAAGSGSSGSSGSSCSIDISISSALVCLL